MEEIKYYVPDITEFYIGFEYQMLFPNGKWMNLIFGDDKINHQELVEFCDDLDKIAHAITRVKYLDEDDILSLGWEKDTKWFFFEATKIDKSNPNAHLLNGSYVSYDSWELWFNEDDYTITINDLEGERRVMDFPCKNKSELKRIMNQLNIE